MSAETNNLALQLNGDTLHQFMIRARRDDWHQSFVGSDIRMLVRQSMNAIELAAELAKLREENLSLKADAARWKWAREIFAGDDTPEADFKAQLLGSGLVLNKTPEQTIDAYIAMTKD